LIPEKFAGLAQMIKTEISKGTITIHDLGVIEKNSNGLSIKLATFLGVDRTNFPVTAHLVAGTDYLEVTMHDPSHDKLEFCVIDVGESLRTYAQQNDPEGMSVMRQAYK
jgi:hypothetical protein